MDSSREARTAEFARALEAQPDLARLLAEVARGAVDLVGPAATAAITTVRRGRPLTVAATDDLARAADELQAQRREGPVLAALSGPDLLHSDDLLTEERWPSWAPLTVRTTGLRSLVAVRLWVRDRRLGTLTLYAGEPSAFTALDRLTTAAVAAHASLALVARQQVDQLEEALSRRTLIGQATGVLMERYGMDADHAFGALRRFSQEQNRKVYDLAEEVLRTRSLPQQGGLVDRVGADGLAASGGGAAPATEEDDPARGTATVDVGGVTRHVV